MSSTAPTISSSRNFALWVAMLAAPTAWMLQLLVVYGLTPWVCDALNPTSLAIAAAAWIALALVGVATSAYLAWGLRSLRRSHSDTRSVSRMQFMTSLGLMSSGLFSLVIIAQVVPMLVFDPCSGTGQ